MADYNNVYKDKCATEFMKLKECYLVSPPNPSSSFRRWQIERRGGRMKSGVVLGVA